MNQPTDKKVWTPKLPPPRPVSDPTIELTLDYVENMKVRHPGCIEARLMRDWLRMYRQLNLSAPAVTEPAVELDTMNFTGEVGGAS